jgi:DNA-binding NarL/FixJ family response regulator
VLLGVRGILGSDTSAEQFIKAILKVSAGELWLDRFTTSRIVSEISNKKRNGAINDDAQLMASLTEREIGILRAILAGEGQALRDIAQTLFISEYTLRNHLTSIYSKLGVRNRLDLYVFARAHFGSGQQK